MKYQHEVIQTILFSLLQNYKRLPYLYSTKYIWNKFCHTKISKETNKLCLILRVIQMRLSVYYVQQYYTCKYQSIRNRGGTGMSCSENWFFTRFKSLSFGVKYLSCVFGVIFL